MNKQVIDQVLTAKQQRKLAEFSGNQYTVKIVHASACGIRQGKACDCEPDLSFKSENSMAADEIVQAINQQTAAIVAALEKEQRFEFIRDASGAIVGAVKKTV